MCAQLLVNTSSDHTVAPSAGSVTLLAVNVTLRNCGSIPLERGDDPRCGPGPYLLLTLGTREYALPVNGANRTATNTDINARSWGPCGIIDHTRDLGPGETAGETATWNGTIAENVCRYYNTSQGSGSMCNPSPRAADTGMWGIEAHYTASDGTTRYEWTAKRTVEVTPWIGTRACVHCPLDANGIVTSSPVDLSLVSAISKARTGEAPNASAANTSSGVCDCGFMLFQPTNPYHCPPDQPACPLPASPPLKVYAPFNGTVKTIHDSAIGHVSYMVIAADADQSLSFWILNTQPAEGLHEGNRVASGQQIALGESGLGIEYNSTGNQTTGTLIVPLSNLFNPNVRDYFAQYGVQPENLTYPDGTTSPRALDCDPTEGHVGPLSQDEWIYLAQKT